LPVNIAYYSSLPKTLKLTPPELMRNSGQAEKDDKSIKNNIWKTE
jgi:hypothetical protein